MASIRQRNGKWEVRIRRLNNSNLSKHFKDKTDAVKWAREYESKLEKGLYEDLSHANSITLRELLQQYRDDVSSTKKGFEEEKYKINKLCKNTIASFKLAKITPLKLRKFQDFWSLNHNPSTVNKYLTLISVTIKHDLQNEKFSIRITGCPNGCARPYAGDIGIVGRAPNLYALFSGGDFEGTRLNKKILDKVSYQDLTKAIEQILLLFKEQRKNNEPLGDFCNRIGTEAQFKKIKEVLNDKIQ
mgnify:CR=1 FL=1